MGSPIDELRKRLKVDEVKLEFDGKLAFDIDKPLSFENKPLSFASNAGMPKLQTMEEFEKNFGRDQETSPRSVEKKQPKQKSTESRNEFKQVIEFLDDVIKANYHRDLTVYCRNFRQEITEGLISRKQIGNKLQKIKKCLEELGIR